MNNLYQKACKLASKQESKHACKQKSLLAFYRKAIIDSMLNRFSKKPCLFPEI